MKKIPYQVWGLIAVIVGYLMYANNDAIRQSIDPLHAPDFHFLGGLTVLAGAIYLLKRKGVF